MRACARRNSFPTSRSTLSCHPITAPLTISVRGQLNFSRAMLSACAGWRALSACRHAAGAVLGRSLLHGSSLAAAEEAQAAQAAASPSPGPLTDSDFDLTEDQQQFKHVAEMFAREELAPYRCLDDCGVKCRQTGAPRSVYAACKCSGPLHSPSS